MLQNNVWHMGSNWHTITSSPCDEAFYYKLMDIMWQVMAMHCHWAVELDMHTSTCPGCHVHPQVAALFTAPGFDTSKHIGYDIMHEVAGVVGDTVVKLLLGVRYKVAVQQFESDQNRWGQLLVAELLKCNATAFGWCMSLHKQHVVHH
jgi:hypothetical protein